MANVKQVTQVTQAREYAEYATWCWRRLRFCHEAEERAQAESRRAFAEWAVAMELARDAEQQEQLQEAVGRQLDKIHRLDA